MRQTLATEQLEDTQLEDIIQTMDTTTFICGTYYKIQEIAIITTIITVQIVYPEFQAVAFHSLQTMLIPNSFLL